MTHFSGTPAQSWAVLRRHAAEFEHLRLPDLCRDADRVFSLVAVHNSPKGMLIVDLSRQRMTLETLDHLLRLSSVANLKKFIGQLEKGQPTEGVSSSSETGKTTRFEEADEGGGRWNNKATELPSSVSMHVALRQSSPSADSSDIRTKNPLQERIHSEWQRIERVSEAIRRGQVRGCTGSQLRNVIFVIGQGVAVEALRFAYQALLHDEQASAGRTWLMNAASVQETTTSRLRRNLMGETANDDSAGGRRLYFLSNMDPVAAASVVSTLDPASTLVVSIALKGNEETGLATKTIKSWLLRSLGQQGQHRRTDLVLTRHMVLVTGNDGIVEAINKPEAVYVIPEQCRCEPFTSFTAATLLPLSIVFGWSVVKNFLDGGRDMDQRFCRTNPRHNLPILLALTDLWNGVLSKGDKASSASVAPRIVTPFCQAFVGYPSFVATLEAQVCSGGGASSLVMDGGLSSTYDRAVYQSSPAINSELVTTLDSQLAFNAGRAFGTGGGSHHHQSSSGDGGGMEEIQALDIQMCSIFSQADELAFGGVPDMPTDTASPTSVSGRSGFGGNRPSMLVLCDKLDAFVCGQLVALAEHRATVKAHLRGLDPFAVQEVASSLRLPRTDRLKEELQNMLAKTENDAEAEDEPNEFANLSTKTILGHYANLMKTQRTRSGNGK